MSLYNSNVASLHIVEFEQIETVVHEMDKVVGDLNDFEVVGQNILVGAWVRPVSEFIPGSSLLRATDQVGRDSSEDAVQGKVVRVLKVGPQAFPAEYAAEWGSNGPPVPGDWLLVEPQFGVQLSVKCSGSQPTDLFKGADSKRIAGHGGWPCRLVFGKDILGRVRLPHFVV